MNPDSLVLQHPSLVQIKERDNLNLDFDQPTGKGQPSLFWIRLTNWEYWNFYAVYFLIGLLHIWQSVKAKSLFYFSASNPGLENSGFIGEKKSGILKILPVENQPKWFLVDGLSIQEIIEKLGENQIAFPCIAKPDVGERGRGVAKIHTKEELEKYSKKIGVPFVIQAFVDLPFEAGIFYYRIPGEKKGVVSSMVIKKFLSVTGDGNSSLADLVDQKPRARLVRNYLSQKFKHQWNQILENGIELELEGIGNHCRGTQFINGNPLISNTLQATIDAFSQRIPGFFFGRFDLRATNLEALEKGDFQILELNGAGAEPAHIYQPGFSFWEGQKVLIHHWNVLLKISQINRKAGHSFWSWNEAMAIRKKHIFMLNSIGI